MEEDDNVEVTGSSVTNIDMPKIARTELEILVGDQMNQELNNSIIYENLANICEYKSLIGASKYLYKQAKDEYGHYEKFRTFMLDRELRPFINGVPEQAFEDSISLQDVFSFTVELEKLNLNKLNNLKMMAMNIDPTVVDFLDWFILNQIIEVKETMNIVRRIQMTNEIILIDQELGNM